MSAIDHLPCPRVGAREAGARCPRCVWFLRCECGETLLSTSEDDAREFCRHAKACGHGSRVYLLVPATSVDSNRAQWKEWTRDVELLGPDVLVVHRLFEGRMVCGLFSGVPGRWPSGHKWSAVLAEVTCSSCREKP